MPTPRRHPAGPLPTRVAAFAVIAALALTACDGGGSDDTKAPKPSEPEPTVNVALAVGEVRVESGGGPVALPDPIRDAVMTTVRNYVEAATIAPLRSGKPAGDLSALFTPPAAARVAAAGPDRDALVDEGLPHATGDVTAENAPVTIVALAEGDGTVVLVSAGLGLVVHGATKDGTVDVKRNAQLVLSNDGGTWKIDSWDATVERTVPVPPTTTTTVKK